MDFLIIGGGIGGGVLAELLGSVLASGFSCVEVRFKGEFAKGLNSIL